MDAAYWRERSAESMLSALTQTPIKREKQFDNSTEVMEDGPKPVQTPTPTPTTNENEEGGGGCWVGSQCANTAARVLLRALDHSAAMNAFVSTTPSNSNSAADVKSNETESP